MPSPKHRILITGANGFIGRYLMEKFSEDQDLHSIAVVRKTPNDNRLANADEILEVGEYLEFDRWPEVLKNVDSIVHVAGIIAADKDLPAEQQKKQIMIANRDITARLAKESVAANVRQFIYLSSMSVYGDGKDRFLTSETEVNFKDDYPESKFAGELELKKVASESELNWIIVRPPMVVGQGTKGTFYSMVKMFAKIGFSPFGSIKSKYPIVKLETLADFFRASVKVPDVDNGIYLVGEPREYIVPEIMTLVSKNEGKTLRHLPCPKWLLRLSLKLIGKQKAFDHLASGLRIDCQKATELIERLENN